MLISYFTYFQGYENPPKQFWDENYHIASAQKYIDGTMYMEPHPPLGKMLIALGERIMEPNKDVSLYHFNQTDYIKTYPRNYSFEGVRFFPTLFATLNALLFFYILYSILKSELLAFLFSSLYLFDNALIVHSRSAMLESAQMFFILSSILYFLSMISNKRFELKNYVTLSIFIGLNLSVKLNGLIMILLFAYLFFCEYENSLKRFIVKLLSSLATISIVFIFFMYLHISLGQNMPTHKEYAASQEYKDAIKDKEASSLKNFPITLKDNLTYMLNYSKGVPKYEKCKKGENGSLAYGWPFGNKTINYRWERSENKIKYLYLAPNPVIWTLGALSILFSIILVGSKYLYGLNVKDDKLFHQITLFLFIYLSYMFVMVNIDRVMYLYHYFIPLAFSLFLSALIFKYAFLEQIENKNKALLASIVVLFISIFVSYRHFSALTYYEAIDYSEFLERTWFEHWQLKAIR